MHHLRGIYSRARIALYAFAIGLASVWSYNAFLVGSESVNVALPTAGSSNVLAVFVERSRFVNKGGGSGPDHPVVSITQIQTRSSVLSFRFENALNKPVYLPKVESKALTRVPYFVECQERENDAIHVVPQDLAFAPNPRKLDSGQSLTLNVNPPVWARACVVIVPYAMNESDASDLALQNPYISSWEHDFLEKVSGRLYVAAISEPISHSP